MRLTLICWLAIWICGFSPPAAALSPAPLLVLNSYIEGNGQCPANLIEWNRKYNAKTIAGEVPRTFYYRAIGFQEWGKCGQPYFKDIFAELQKIWLIFAAGEVSQVEVEAKEEEVINLMFAALNAGSLGKQMVQRYEAQISRRLAQLEPERQFFNCTYFGDKPKCAD